MARLDELFDVKENAMSAMIKDNSLINALLLKDIDSPIVDRTNILYKHIFPYKKAIDETLEDKMCFITMDTSAFGSSEGKFKTFSIIFYALVHEDLLRMKLGNRTVVRTDFLIHRIDSLFNQTRGFGIGRLQFGGTRTVELPNDWIGVGIFYETIDFN